MNTSYDFDCVVMGSGFGGSVSACRLTEKGYSAGVMEMGKRWKVEDFPKSDWDADRFIWRPGMGLHGFYNMRPFRHVVVMCDSALLVPSPKVWKRGSWVGLKDWKQVMSQHYAAAERMLGITGHEWCPSTSAKGHNRSTRSVLSVVCGKSALDGAGAVDGYRRLPYCQRHERLYQRRGRWRGWERVVDVL